jgi:hypothetical protein
MTKDAFSMFSKTIFGNDVFIDANLTPKVINFGNVTNNQFAVVFE